MSFVQFTTENDNRIFVNMEKITMIREYEDFEGTAIYLQGRTYSVDVSQNYDEVIKRITNGRR